MAVLTHMARRAAGAAGLLSLVVLLAACPCDPGQPEVFYDSFEEDCDTLPCGWNLLAGQASHVVTYHAGEHGLELSGNARVERALAGVVLASEGDPASVSMVLRRDPEAGLSLTLEIESGGDVRTLTAELQPGRNFEPHLLEPVRLWLPGDEETSYQGWNVLRIVIEHTGTGSCVLDDLRILSGFDQRCAG
jgi:hypothetical protein